MSTTEDNYDDGYPKGNGAETHPQILYDAEPEHPEQPQPPHIATAFRYLDHIFAIRNGTPCSNGGFTTPRTPTPLEQSVEDAALITIHEYLQPDAIPTCSVNIPVDPTTPA